MSKANELEKRLGVLEAQLNLVRTELKLALVETQKTVIETRKSVMEGHKQMLEAFINTNKAFAQTNDFMLSIAKAQETMSQTQFKVGLDISWTRLHFSIVVSVLFGVIGNFFVSLLFQSPTYWNKTALGVSGGMLVGLLLVSWWELRKGFKGK